MNKFHGTKVTISEGVKYIGEGKDAADDIFMIAYTKALKEIYQPERSKREDSTYDKIKDDEMGKYYAQRINLVEMRCSEL